MFHIWHYEWDEMIKLTSCVRANDRFMTLRVRQCDQFMKVWTKPTILLLHHNYPFIENISETKRIFVAAWVRPDVQFMTQRVRPNMSFIPTMSRTKCSTYNTMSDIRCFIYLHHIRRQEPLPKFWVWLDTACMIHLQHFERDKAMNWLHYESYHQINLWHHEWYQLIHLWDHELDQIFHLLHLNWHHISYLLKPWVGSSELFETSWLKPGVLFIDTMSGTK